MTKMKMILITMLLILLQSSIVHSYKVNTHDLLSEKAVELSSLDSYLRTELGFQAGVVKKFSGVETIKHVRNGSKWEDNAQLVLSISRFLRFNNHFHNPLRTWNDAGLRSLFGIEIGNSSILWGQGPDLQQPGNPGGNKSFTWQDARERFFEGLTATNQTDRDEKLALAFRTIGHLIHLVQDAAVPAHVRSDAHVEGEPLESFVKKIIKDKNFTLFDQLTSNPIKFDPSISFLAAEFPVAHPDCSHHRYH